jgi:formate hydrogenlyase subunit 3/multisubunit Na+/H+ antiporter MnhD subunit
VILLPFPLFLPTLLLVLALFTYLFRRVEQITAAIAGLVVGGLAFWLTGDIPANGLVHLLGRFVQVDMRAQVMRFDLIFQLTPAATPILTLVLFLTTTALILNATVGQGRSFPPFALLLASGYSLLLLLMDAPVNPEFLAPGFLAVLAALGVYVLQAGQLGQTIGPLRSLLPPLLAFPLFILASWHIDSLAINPQDMVAEAAAARFLALGLLLLLAPVPFHSATPAMAETAPPIPVALLSLLYQLATLTLLFRITQLYPFVVELSGQNLWLTAAGLVTAVWGGLAAVGSSHPARLWSYAMIHDWGLILLMLAAPGSASWSLVIFLFSLRVISVLAGAMGLAYLRDTAGSLEPSHLTGAGRMTPWSTSAYVLGSLGLAGFPLSAGFTGHWAALQVVAENDWRVAATVLLASSGVVLGFVRMIRLLYNPRTPPKITTEHLTRRVVAIAAILIVSGVALAPQLLSRPLAWILQAFRG